jgi:hypothetical protein
MVTSAPWVPTQGRQDGRGREPKRRRLVLSCIHGAPGDSTWRIRLQLAAAVLWADLVRRPCSDSWSEAVRPMGRNPCCRSFVWPNPSLLIDGYGQPVLLYPLKNALASPPWPKDVHDSDALGALLGATRAAVLSATANGENTTRIAQRLSISIASASQHLSVLLAAAPFS